MTPGPAAPDRSLVRETKEAETKASNVDLRSEHYFQNAEILLALEVAGIEMDEVRPIE